MHMHLLHIHFVYTYINLSWLIIIINAQTDWWTYPCVGRCLILLILCSCFGNLYSVLWLVAHSKQTDPWLSSFNSRLKGVSMRQLATEQTMKTMRMRQFYGRFLTCRNQCKGPLQRSSDEARMKMERNILIISTKSYCFPNWDLHTKVFSLGLLYM